jgi:hypothetical protein
MINFMSSVKKKKKKISRENWTNTDPET